MHREVNGRSATSRPPAPSSRYSRWEPLLYSPGYGSRTGRSQIDALRSEMRQLALRAIFGPPMSLINLLFAIAIFLGSFLLFLVEPLAAKRLLPLLGGSAAIWTTCLVFFQTTLLLGYLCAHLLATRLAQRTQVAVYFGLLAACLGQASLNLHPDLRTTTAHPVVSVFTLLSSLIGLPFLALSATNPLLQAWYARRA